MATHEQQVTRERIICSLDLEKWYNLHISPCHQSPVTSHQSTVNSQQSPVTSQQSVIEKRNSLPQ
ncbi:hypothetical protein H6G27_28940 [Nostoc linckia FACHB-104]|nr:hypothetical protein [Nostoc linckia FACHB-104]